MPLKERVTSVLPHPVYRMIRKRRVAQQIARYEPRVVEHLYGHERLRVLIADAMSEQWYDRDYHGDGELTVLVDRGLLRDRTLIFDLGAHQGIVALGLAWHDPNGRVIAVEAEPHNVRVARENLRLNPGRPVELVHAAVTDFDGTVSFAEGLNGRVDAATTWGNVEVPALTIDTLATRYGQPDLVFVDIEGSEGLALAGASRTLASGAAFLVEVHGDRLIDATPQTIADYFAGTHDLHVTDDIGGGPGVFAPLTGPVGREGLRHFLVAVPR